MSGPRLEAIRLEYGCHSGRFDLPDEGRPVVIAGRNGSGKTTLLEAFLRALYGFNRRKGEEKRLLDLRQPWSARPAEAEVWLTSGNGRRIRVLRDFATDEVVATDEERGVELFRGDGNPVGARSESRRYQDLLREWIGFGTLDPYRSSAWIAQGELVDTKLDDELLRAAAGTHRRVEVALKELRDGFEALTREPLELGGRRKNLSRDLENSRESLERARRRLEVARAAREKKRPLLGRAQDIRQAVQQIQAEIDRLEAAYRPITERRTLVAEQREAESRLTALSDATRALERSAGELARAEAEAEAAKLDGSYPADLEARLGQAEILWDRRDRLGQPDDASAEPAGPGSMFRRGGITIAGAVLAAVGAGVALTASGSVGVAIGTAGLVMAAVGVWLGRFAEAQRLRAVDGARRRLEELETIGTRLAAIAGDLPGPPLARSTVAEHRHRHRRQADSRAALARARERHGEAAERAMALLESASSAPEAWNPEALRRLEEAGESARTALAKVQLRLEELPVTPSLPDGVEPTVPALESAREERRERRDALREQLTRLELELRDLDRASEDVFALERETASLLHRVGEIEDEVSVRRLAWELVRDAYAEFRSTDQSRLVSAINRRMQQLSGGRLGPVEAPDDLAAARVGLDGRMVALDSPPLSFGEKHAALLAIRLGAADFLSGEGAHHPLLVDEPFTHLDEVRSREVWGVLNRLAADRQVIITTQDRLVLNHLDIAPDFDLAVPHQADDASSARGEAPRADDARAAEVEKSPAVAEPREPEAPAAPVQAQLELG